MHPHPRKTSRLPPVWEGTGLYSHRLSGTLTGALSPHFADHRPVSLVPEIYTRWGHQQRHTDKKQLLESSAMCLLSHSGKNVHH